MRNARPVADGVAALLLMAAALALSIATIVHRPQSTLNTAFLFQDEGLNLLVAGVLRSGEALYRDVAYPYGPIPASLHAAFAAMFGNTPLVYLWFVALASSVTVGLAYLLIRRAAGVPVAVFVASIGIVTVIIVPGSLIGGQTTASYVPIERAILILVALLWAAPWSRSWKRSIGAGLLLGVWQLVRFGGALVAGASVLVLDVLAIAASRADRQALAAWRRSLVTIAAGFAAVELAWIGVAFSTLPGEIARDAVWPAYMLDTYAGWVTASVRWLPWAGWRLFVAQYLLPFSAAALGVAGLCAWLRDSRAEPGGGAVFVPLIFFAIGCASYFRQVHHFRQFMWALVPSSAWALQRRGAAWRSFTGLLWAPGFATLLRSSLWAAAPSLVSVTLPTGGTIVATPPLAARLQFLERFVDVETGGAPVIFLDSGAGWYYVYRVPHATRHTWFAGFDAIRPYDQQAFIEALDRTAALIECEKDDRPLTSAEPRLPFPPAVRGALRPRLALWTSGAGCRIYRLTR